MPKEHPLLSAKMLAVLAVLGVLWGGGMALVLADRLPIVGIVMGFLASLAIISLYAKPFRQALRTGEWDGPEMPSKTELIIAVVCAAGAPLVLIYLYLLPASAVSVAAIQAPVRKAEVSPLVTLPAKQEPNKLTPPSAPQDSPSQLAITKNHPKSQLPGAKWTVANIQLDPPFDEANLKPTYRVKLTARNDGDGASSVPNTRHAMIVPAAPLDRLALDQRFQSAAAVPLDADFLRYTSPALEKGQPVFSDLDGDIPQVTARAVHEGKLRLYVPIIFSWVDVGTPKGMYRTSEFCGYLLGSDASYNLCDYHNTEPRLKRLPNASHLLQAHPDKPKEK